MVRDKPDIKKMLLGSPNQSNIFIRAYLYPVEQLQNGRRDVWKARRRGCHGFRVLGHLSSWKGES